MTRPRYSTTPEQIVKTALMHALDERESFIDAHRGCRDADFLEAVRRAEVQMHDYQLMLKRRFRLAYEGTVGELSRRAGKSIPIDQVAMGKK